MSVSWEGFGVQGSGKSRRPAAAGKLQAEGRMRLPMADDNMREWQGEALCGRWKAEGRGEEDRAELGWASLNSGGREGPISRGILGVGGRMTL